MRCCPKCGEKYDDHDIRTLCSSCLVSLISCDETEDSSVSVSHAGPITVGSPISMETMTMPTAMTTLPTITIPEVRLPEIPEPTIPTEVPQIPPAPSQPTIAPDTPPLMPQPDPDYPQPTIIPEPTPMPVPPQQPQEPMPVAPAPAQQAHPVDDIPSSQIKRENAKGKPQQYLTNDEQIMGKLSSVLYAIMGGIVCLIAVVNLFSTRAEDFGFWTLVVNGGLLFLGVYLVRQAIYRSVIQRAKLVVVGTPCLGKVLCFDATIGVLRTVPVTGGTLTVTAEEEAVSGSGKSQTTHRRTIFTRTLPLTLPEQWRAGSIITLTPQCAIPIDAVPSFKGKHNSIKWKAQLWVGIPGFYPDVRLTVPLYVPAVRIQSEQQEAVPCPRYALTNLGDLNAEITLDCPIGPNKLPCLHAGRSVPFSLDITPKKIQENEAIWVELSYQISGDGDGETMIVSRVPCFRRGWHADTQQQEQATLTIPKDAPITYHGTHVRVDWMVSVKKEIPWKKDLRQIFEVHVVPDEAE